MILEGPISDRWELTSPITLTVEGPSEDGFIVSDDFSVSFGNGDTLEDALEDYKADLSLRCDGYEDWAANYITNFLPYIRRRRPC